MRTTVILMFFFLTLHLVFPQSNTNVSGVFRGSIPEELLRPKRGEDPHYPVDTIIGELGQGRSSYEAFTFAKTVAESLMHGNTDHVSLSGISKAMRENYLSVLEPIAPQSYRMGSGREEPDGAVSFLVRFVGREQAVTGELFIRLRDVSISAPAALDTEEKEDDVKEVSAAKMTESSVARVWTFDELILENPRTREAEQEMTKQNYDINQYERFF